MAVQPAQQPVIVRRLFTVDEYYRLAEVGLLKEDDRVELIDGEILQLNPIGDRHYSCVIRLTDLFSDGLGKAVIVVPQAPIRLSRRAEPEPDIAVVRRTPDFYASGKPTPVDIFLVIEVADSSLEYDRQVKAPLYARHGIPELWIVDLINSVIEVYRDPAAEGYRSIQTVQRGDVLHPLAFPDLQVAVDAILG
jgi:Uma2 family endonuclease